MRSPFGRAGRRLLWIAWAALATVRGAAADEPAPWIEDAAGCKFFNAHPAANERIHWSGGCRDGFGDGAGVLEWFEGDKPGSRVEGSFVHGAIQGRGHLVSGSGATYDGSFENGEISGFGTMIWPNGDRYDGGWKDGKRSGHGTFVRPNGDRYDGDFVEGYWQGKGLYVTLSGLRYSGDWVRSKRQGEGTAVLLGGGLYRGAFVDDAPAHPEDIKHNHYDLRVAQTGSHISKALITNLDLPADQTYEQLSEDDKFIARAKAGTPSESDEPPYPLHGPHQILESSIEIQNRLRVEGNLVLGVTVDASGTAQSVSALSSPDSQLTMAMARILMLEKYKPALCAGKPCIQKYYFRMHYHRAL
jgi:hypothetical protein